jgi:hypothetical protein
LSLWVRSGREQTQQKGPLFGHRIGEHEQVIEIVKVPSRLLGLIDQLELNQLLDRPIGGLGAAQKV